MKRNRILYACFCIMILVGLQSCYEDKGNYDYVDINEISFEGIEESYIIKAGDPITIKPIIVSTISGGEENYTYKWVVDAVIVDGKDKYLYTWSTLKEWDGFSLGLPIGTYKFSYIVSDPLTEIEWRSSSFNITVESSISPGFLILSEIENVGRVDFINYYKDELEFKQDILGKLGTKLPSLEDPIRLVCGNDKNSPRMGATTQEGQYMVGIFTQKGGYRLHPYTFAYDELYDIKKNIFGVAPSGFYVDNACMQGTSSVMVDNKRNLYNSFPADNIFWTIGGYSNVLVDGTYVEISGDFYNYAGQGTIVYDTKLKSFACQIGTRDYLTYFDSEYETIFKYNNTGCDLVFIHGRAIEKDERRVTYAVLKDSSKGNYYLCKFSLAGKQFFYREINTPNLAEAKGFVMTVNRLRADKANEFLYYYTDRQIHMYNMADLSSEVVYTAPSGERISYVKFAEWGNWADDMMVFTYDESKPAESCGTMQVMKVRPAYGTLSLAEHNGQKMEWTGFGKVISAEWKNK